MATKIELGSDNNWGVKSGGVLAFNRENNIFKAIELASSRASGGTYVSQSGLIADAEVGVPRIDWTNGVGELLLEPASTNYVTYSEDFTDASWLTIGSPTRTANYGISPDGTQTSTRIQFTTTNESVYKNVPTVVTGNYVSIYVKGTSGETIQFGMGANVAQGQLFTLNGDWQRLEVAAGNVSAFFIGTFQSATARDIEVWGAQAEPLNYTTSYIRNLTTGSTSRIADAVTGNSSLGQVINSSEGVLYAEMSAFEISRLSLNNGATSNRIIVGQDGDGDVRAQIDVSSSTVFNVPSATIPKTLGNTIKIALKWKLNDFAFWVDGVEEATNLSGAIFSSNVLNTLEFNAQGVNFYGRIRDLRVYDTALTDAELTALTTL